MRKYLIDMNVEELGKVFTANSKLKDEVREDMVESEMSWVSEKLDFIQGSLYDYSIGLHSHNFLSIKDYDKFIEGMEEMDASIPALIDSDKPLMDEATEARDRYRNMDMYSDEADEAEEEMEKVAEKLAATLLERFSEDLNGCYNEGYQIDYFMSSYVELRMGDSKAYIDSSDYILKEDITKTYN